MNLKILFLYQTPPLIITFLLTFYFCEKNLIYFVVFSSLFFLGFLKILYYSIPFFPKDWRIRFVGIDKTQLIILLIYFLSVTISSLGYIMDLNK